MIKDYLRSPALYKAKYIDKSLPPKVLSPSMKIGTAVDCLLTGDASPLTVCSKGSSGDNSLISENDFRKAKIMATAVAATKFWQDMKEKATFQIILEGSIGGLQVCGKPDILWRRVDGDVQVLDLKTARESAARSPRSFEYQAIELGYFVQLAMYRELLRQNGVEIQGQGFVVVGLGMDEVPLIHTVRVHPAALDAGWKAVLYAIDGIKNGRFDAPEPKAWGEASWIGVPNEEDNTAQEPEDEESDE